jgi:hypothetical protein
VKPNKALLCRSAILHAAAPAPHSAIGAAAALKVLLGGLLLLIVVAVAQTSAVIGK